MNATIEAGLPGTGPLPIHLHTGRPTPWSEGCVIRFTPETGDAWVGNLQTGYRYATKVIKWPEANAFVVIAEGAAYFIRPNEPTNWVFFDRLGIDCVITPHFDIALLLTYNDVIAISTKGTELWRRSVAIDGVEVTKVEDGLIYGSAGIDPPDGWHPFLLDLATGNDAERPNGRGSE